MKIQFLSALLMALLFTLNSSAQDFMFKLDPKKFKTESVWSLGKGKTHYSANVDDILKNMSFKKGDIVIVETSTFGAPQIKHLKDPNEIRGLFMSKSGVVKSVKIARKMPTKKVAKAVGKKLPVVSSLVTVLSIASTAKAASNSNSGKASRSKAIFDGSRNGGEKISVNTTSSKSLNKSSQQ